jgi:hypothetical protein
MPNKIRNPTEEELTGAIEKLDTMVEQLQANAKVA